MWVEGLNLSKSRSLNFELDIIIVSLPIPDQADKILNGNVSDIHAAVFDIGNSWLSDLKQLYFIEDTEDRLKFVTTQKTQMIQP